MVMRVGFGCDTHRTKLVEAISFVPIHGIKIQTSFAVEAHSDGDVGLHSLIDAILGACAKGDIGEHFPDTDPKWKGRDSEYFLLHALQILNDMGGKIVNIDSTVISESIRLGSLKGEMRSNLSRIVKIPESSINIKAKTAERMGALGRSEGLGAYTAVMIEL